MIASEIRAADSHRFRGHIGEYMGTEKYGK